MVKKAGSTSGKEEAKASGEAESRVVSTCSNNKRGGGNFGVAWGNGNLGFN